MSRQLGSRRGSGRAEAPGPQRHTYHGPSDDYDYLGAPRWAGCAVATAPVGCAQLCETLSATYAIARELDFAVLVNS